MTSMPELNRVTLEGYNGLRLTADVGGDPAAQPIVFLHGGGQTRHAWHRAARELIAAGYYALSYDARGHGDSDWAAEQDYRLDAFIGDLLAVLRSLRQPPALVGASLGGITALTALGESDVPIARALVLVDVIPNMRVEGVLHIREFMGSTLGGFANLEEAADAVARYLPTRPRPRDPSGLMKNLRRGEDGRLYWRWDPAFFQGGDRFNAVADRPRFNRAATRLALPTLLVRGKESDVVTREDAEAFQNSIPGCEFVDVIGAGHMVAGDRNDVFNHAVLDFLARRVPLGQRVEGGHGA